MKVRVAGRLYRMNHEEYLKMLKIAGEQVPFGIYAVEKQGYAELRCDKCKSRSRLKRLIRQFKVQGFKVHANDENQ